MNRFESPYKGSGSLTREQFYFYEMRTTARLMCEGLGDTEIIDKIITDNLFQYPTERTIKRAASACVNRLHMIDGRLVTVIADQDSYTAKQVCLYAVMRQYRIFWDFMITVIGAKYRQRDFTFNRREINTFFLQLQEQDDTVAGWSEATVKRISQVFIRILRDMVIAGTRTGGRFMAQDSQNHKDKLYAQVQEQYGKTLYSYTCHWKTADHLKKTVNTFKWIQIILSALSAGGCLATIITDQAKLAWISGIVSTFLLVVSGYLKDKDFTKEQKEHQITATKLWVVREEYLSLLTDFDTLQEQDIVNRRDDLIKKTAKIYESAPQTDEKSYKEAQIALRNKEEQFFTQEELNVMLPIHLRMETKELSE